MSGNWVLWGSHPQLANGQLIRLKTGSLRECESERRYREKLGGYHLGIYRRGTDPTGLRLQVLTAEAQGLGLY